LNVCEDVHVIGHGMAVVSFCGKTARSVSNQGHFMCIAALPPLKFGLWERGVSKGCTIVQGLY